jgi:hypothetical protein
VSTGAPRWRVGHAVRVWLTGPYFLWHLRDFVLLWMIFKGINMATAVIAGVSPLGFRPASEVAALGFECLALSVFTLRDQEIVPAANVGVSVPLLLLPFAALHAVLSLGVSLLP